MNKADIKLIISLLIIVALSFLGFNLFKTSGAKSALVYSSNKLVLTINLSEPSYQEYKVTGKLGPIVIVKENGRVRVKSETSPMHLCSKQGWISNSYETLVCLPNEVIIKIEATSTLDTVVK